MSSLDNVNHIVLLVVWKPLVPGEIGIGSTMDIAKNDVTGCNDYSRDDIGQCQKRGCKVVIDVDSDSEVKYHEALVQDVLNDREAERESGDNPGKD